MRTCIGYDGINWSANNRIHQTRGFSSTHPGGAQFVLCDGSVRFISENMDYVKLTATATTDEQGRYTLAYTYGVTGTKVGPTTVMFEWPLGGSGPPIPAKYTGMNSELKVNVEKGSNEFNFDLTSN